jgi:uncharacterized protein YjbJ (UPF0337 family)
MTADGNGQQDSSSQKEAAMSTDEAKGRLKEAAGDVTDDDDLKREGKTDQAVGDVKKKVDEAGDKAKDTLTSHD